MGTSPKGGGKAATPQQPDKLKIKDLLVQLLQVAEGIAHILPLGQQLIEDGGVGFGGGVEQHHRSVVDPGQQLGESFLLRGLVIVALVGIRKAPEYRPVTQIPGHFQILLAVNTLGRPVVFGQVLAGGLLK